jgi:hypothetical protein
MVNLNNITLVSVTSVNLKKTINALKFSKKDINFYETLLITDKNISEDDIKTIKVEPLDYIGYSRFIVYELHKYINTDFALIIQNDGFIVNPNKWNNEFLNYDYIGAVFPIPPDDDKISYRDPFGNLIRVGNGGFSLRSKKLLQLPTLLNLEWKPYFDFFNEDGFFSVHNRHIFEDNGCKFSPVDIAVQFSIEKETPETVGVTPFGFHGKNNRYINLI